MRYVVVFRDHDGDWHSVADSTDWDGALARFSAMVHTLSAMDYYPDFPPTVAKIVDGSQAGQAGSDYYAQAPALAEAVERPVSKADIQSVRRFIAAYPHASDDEIMAETGLTKMQVVDCQKAITDGYIIDSMAFDSFN